MSWSKRPRRCRHADPEAFARCEADLVAAATELKFVPFANTVTYFTQMADPDGAEEADMARIARRDAYVAPVGQTYALGGNLDQVSGAIVAGELGRLEQIFFEEDWAQAKERLGRDPKAGDLARTPAQRRADALVEMALRSKGAKAGDRRPEPSFSVLVGYESLYGPISRIEGGPIITPGALVPWMDGANFERIVFSPGTRIECSPKARFFTGATRRAIEVRDQECTHPFCDVPADRCQIDHIVPYAKGGETTQENGQAHCGFHNRQTNHGPPGGGDRGGDDTGTGATIGRGGGDRATTRMIRGRSTPFPISRVVVSHRWATGFATRQSRASCFSMPPLSESLPCPLLGLVASCSWDDRPSLTILAAAAARCSLPRVRFGPHRAGRSRPITSANRLNSGHQ